MNYSRFLDKCKENAAFVNNCYILENSSHIISDEVYDNLKILIESINIQDNVETVNITLTYSDVPIKGNDKQITSNGIDIIKSFIAGLTQNCDIRLSSEIILTPFHYEGINIINGVTCDISFSYICKNTCPLC